MALEKAIIKQLYPVEPERYKSFETKVLNFKNQFVSIVIDDDFEIELKRTQNPQVEVNLAERFSLMNDINPHLLMMKNNQKLEEELEKI